MRRIRYHKNEKELKRQKATTLNDSHTDIDHMKQEQFVDGEIENEIEEDNELDISCALQELTLQMLSKAKRLHKVYKEENDEIAEELGDETHNPETHEYLELDKLKKEAQQDEAKYSHHLSQIRSNISQLLNGMNNEIEKAVKSNKGNQSQTKNN